MKKRALISVFYKEGVVEFANFLVSKGVEIISTGGTYRHLKENGVPVIEVNEVTNFPEMLDGRVKTLHPLIHAGILAIRDNKEHMETLKERDIQTIDYVVVNLYPFFEKVREDLTFEEKVEFIDIGGPTMLRAAAKNYQDVSVVIDPTDYEQVLSEIKETGAVSVKTNFYLAAKVFNHTAYYDTMIANYLRDKAGLPKYPDTISMTFEKVQDMRYGENPHQSAAFYKEVGNSDGMLSGIEQLHGKELSFNNINDLHGALELLKEFDEEPTVVACKHSNPCGVASGKDIHEAYVRAYNTDPVSIFGGILCANRKIDKATAEEISKIFLEIVLAPDFDDDALEVLEQKKNIRLLKLKDVMKKQPETAYDVKKVSGGILIQDIDSKLLGDELKVVTDRKPTEKEMEDLLFTWKVVKFTKSNGIAIGKDKQSVGIGPGQVNRIWATEQAIDHGTKQLGADVVKGAVLASDAFFPFDDCVEAAHKAGITAIIQPGGSKRDQDSIDACNKYGIAMVFTGMRHFRH